MLYNYSSWIENCHVSYNYEYCMDANIYPAAQFVTERERVVEGSRVWRGELTSWPVQ